MHHGLLKLPRHIIILGVIVSSVVVKHHDEQREAALKDENKE